MLTPITALHAGGLAGVIIWYLGLTQVTPSLVCAPIEKVCSDTLEVLHSRFGDVSGVDIILFGDHLIRQIWIMELAISLW